MSVIIDEGEEFLPNRERKVTNAVGVKNNEKGAVGSLKINFSEKDRKLAIPIIAPCVFENILCR